MKAFGFQVKSEKIMQICIMILNTTMVRKNCKYSKAIFIHYFLQETRWKPTIEAEVGGTQGRFERSEVMVHLTSTMQMERKRLE